MSRLSTVLLMFILSMRNCGAISSEEDPRQMRTYRRVRHLVVHGADTEICFERQQVNP